MSLLTNDEELQDLITSKMDVVEFLDTIEMSFEELVAIVFPELNEEQRSQLKRTLSDE